MSQLLNTLLSQINTVGHFSLLGTDGYTIIAHNLQGLFSLEVLNPAQESTLSCYSDWQRIVNQVKLHVTL
jgi:hypothetical protein